MVIPTLLRIAIFASETTQCRSGLGRLVGTLANGLSKRGHQVTLVNPSSHLLELKFGLHPVANGFQPDEFDVVNVHGPSAFFSDIALWTNLAKSRDIAYTYHCEPVWFSKIPSRLYTSAHRLLTRQVAKSIIVHTSDYLRFFPQRMVKLVPIPVTLAHDFDSLDFNKSGRLTILFVGQLRPYKGIGLIPKLAQRFPEYDFIIVGDGYLRWRLLSETRNLPNVRVLGPITDEELVKWYEACHVILLPSLNTSEAFGICLLEGALFGCIPVASNLPGVRENVRTLGGFTYPVNSVQVLVTILTELGNDPDLLSFKSGQSRTRALAYAKAHSEETYLDLYEEILGDSL